MNDEHRGGCLCGNIRYTTRGEPMRVVACHCTMCQRRTGGGFLISVWFKDGDWKVDGEERLEFYQHTSDESGRWLKLGFCPGCGTIVTHTAEWLPGMRSFSGGSFDDPKWFEVKRHIWMRSARLDDAPLPAGTETFDKGSPPPAAAPKA